MKIIFCSLLLSLLLAGPSQAQTLMMAAASTREGAQAAAQAYQKESGQPVNLAFAASSTLARQIMLGAPADLFLSANQAWMDRLASKGMLEVSRFYLANQLVLVAPKSLESRPGGSLAQYLVQVPGRIAMGDPAHVPAGQYGAAALKKMGLWEKAQKRLVPTANTRMALALVERGECRLGLVYRTDALASKKVQILAHFPEAVAPKVKFYLGRIKKGREEAQGLYDYLVSTPGRSHFEAQGFESP